MKVEGVLNEITGNSLKDWQQELTENNWYTVETSYPNQDILIKMSAGYTDKAKDLIMYYETPGLY